MSLDLEALRKEALALCAPQFERIDTICLKNTEKVLKAYKEAQISSYQFAGTSGYGYSDMGREKLDEVFARVFKAEKALVRPHFVSGDYYDLEESSESTTRFSSVHVKQAASTNVLVNGITLTNGLTRNNYYVELNGEYAESTLCGMSVLDKEQQMDTYSHITHAVPNCTSNELFKNVLNDHAVGVFSGRILVKEDAQKTAAYQTNRNLCATRDQSIL